jgi:predicted ribosomally synthesized peptide with SipW-like signal peptide
MAPTSSTRRRKVTATVAVVAVIGIAGGYGTYAAFTDTTTLNGTASAGSVQLNAAGNDEYTISASGLMPGDAPSVCFDVAAPSPPNAETLSVSLAATNTSTSDDAADTALAEELDVTLERAPGTGADYATQNAIADGALERNDECDSEDLGTPNATVGPKAISSINELSDSFSLAVGSKVRYRVTLSLPSNADAAAQGGTAEFKLVWTGSYGTT